MNAEEIQFIVDQLFIGNNLAAGQIQTPDGATIDLRNIRSPIVVFCSKGDNITPPQQALGWILDLYDDVDEIRSYGQTIVYTIHESIGHLGIFVSAGVAKKEHSEFSSNIDLIEVLPPGLYEATFEAKSPETLNPDLVSGEWIMRCEQRTLDDIRALGGNDDDDERRFATAARVSEINLALYRNFAQSMVRAMTLAPVAEWTRRLHPLRLQYEVLTDANPSAAVVASAAEQVRTQRRPAAAGNPFVEFEQITSQGIVKALDAWRDIRDNAVEWTFLTAYGNRWLQAAVGIDPKSTQTKRKITKSPLHRAAIEARIEELKSCMEKGGLREALTRAMIFVGLARGGVDERGAEALRRAHVTADGSPPLTLAAFKAMVREQYFMLLIDQDAALAAIPGLLPQDPAQRLEAFATLSEILGARGGLIGKAAERRNRVAQLFGVEVQASPAGNDLQRPAA